MAQAGEVIDLKKALEKALESGAVEQVLDILIALEKLKIAANILSESKVGAVVKAVTTKHPKTAVATKASSLLREWTRIVKEDKEQAAAKATSKKEKAAKPPKAAVAASAAAATTEAAASADAKVASSGEASVAVSGASSSAPIAAPPASTAAAPAAGPAATASAKPAGKVKSKSAKPKASPSSAAPYKPLCDVSKALEGLSDMRRKTYTLLAGVLQTGLGANIDHKTTQRTQELAVLIEIGIEEAHSSITFPHKYGDRVRTLVINMKKNAALRSNVMSGSTPAQSLATISDKELATAEVLHLREEAAAELTEARMLDWEKAHAVDLALDNGVDPNNVWVYDDDDVSDAGND